MAWLSFCHVAMSPYGGALRCINVLYMQQVAHCFMFLLHFIYYFTHCRSRHRVVVGCQLDFIPNPYYVSQILLILNIL